MNPVIERKWMIPPHYMFVMGDNSKDSREIGPIPMDHMLGKVLL